jgi:hypothetical protein
MICYIQSSEASRSTSSRSTAVGAEADHFDRDRSPQDPVGHRPRTSSRVLRTARRTGARFRFEHGIAISCLRSAAGGEGGPQRWGVHSIGSAATTPSFGSRPRRRCSVPHRYRCASWSQASIRALSLSGSCSPWAASSMIRRAALSRTISSWSASSAKTAWKAEVTTAMTSG